MRSIALPSVFLFALPLFVACGPVPAPGADNDEETAAATLRAGPPAYQDVEETFTNPIDQDRWFELKHALQHDFDDICGDTFCEGDFSNLASMSLRCSVSTRTGQLKSCLWLFAGSYETVTASTGAVRPVAKFFHCKLPVQGTPAALMDALLAPGARGPLWQPLPGSGRPIYDVLGDCL
jgi:hypothetical protein